MLAGSSDHLSADDLYERIGDRAPGIHRATIYRTIEALVRAGVVAHVHLPHGAATYHLIAPGARAHLHDPEICHYDAWVLAHRSEVEGYRLPFYMDAPDADLSGRAPRPERRYIRHGEPGMGYVLDQDGAQLPLVQRGVRSRGFGGVRLSYQEVRLRHYYEQYWRYFAEA